MKIFDCHLHCEGSTDSSMTLAEAVQVAEKQDIGLCVTEHWDYDYPTNPDAFHFDIPEYVERVKNFQSENVLLGIEIGMQPHLAKKNAELAKKAEFDFVLCSIHCVKGMDIYEPKYYFGKTKEQVVEEYLTDMLTCLKNHTEIDALAHPDYITRYWPFNAELRLKDAPILWDEVFKEIIRREIPLEINTRRTDMFSAISCYEELLTRYKNLGGKFFTVGSDAHNTDSVGRRIKEAIQLGKKLKLTPVYFKHRKKIPIQ